MMDESFRQYLKRIKTYRGIIIKVDKNLDNIKQGLDKILESMDFEKTSIKDNLIYSCGRYTKKNIEKIQEYLIKHQLLMNVYKGKQADFDGPYWIKNTKFLKDF